MAKDKRSAGRMPPRRKQPPGLVLIVMIATFSIGTLLICAQVARLVYATGITGDIRSRLHADYRPWTPQAFAPVSTGITLGTPAPVKGTSILDATGTATCSPAAEGCDPNLPASPDLSGTVAPAPTDGSAQPSAP
jgi:hypothetical protein